MSTRLCILLAMLTLPLAALAEDEPRFGPFEPNYAVIQGTSDDDHSLEVHYSFRYSFTPLDWPRKHKPELLFTYTGEFDFYWLEQRDSSPVVNRISQPAFHLRLRSGPWPDWMRWIDLGAEHRSNGQVVEVDARLPDDDPVNPGRLRTRVEHEEGNDRYFDALSRGANFLSAEMKFRVGKPVIYHDDTPDDYPFLGFDLWVSAKAYVTTSAEVNWGRYADTGVDISDYDRFRIVLAKRYTLAHRRFRIHESGVSVDWRFGDNGLYGDSIRIGWLTQIQTLAGVRLPLFLRFHWGPLSTLSNYTKEQRSWAFVGLQFR